MQPSDRDLKANGDVIPFRPRKAKSNGLLSTTMAVLVAVTIIHDDDTSAEEKLLSIIESTGEIEIMDSVEAVELLDESTHMVHQRNLQEPANDNNPENGNNPENDNT